MNPKHGRDHARPQIPVMPVILSGGAWVARRIRSNCLRQHCHILATTFRSVAFIRLKKCCARVFFVLETRSSVLTEIHPNELDVVAAVARIGAYADQWVSAPEDWRPDLHLDPHAQWADLLRHLFAVFNVPVCFDKAWEIRGPLDHFERDCWCALAQGRSLRRVHGFPPSVSHRVLHAALTRHGSASRVTFVHAIWRAQLAAFHASPNLTDAVMSSRAAEELTHHGTWMRLAAKFTAETEMEAAQFPLVTDALTAILDHRGSAQVEALLRLPLHNLIRHCTRFVLGLLERHGHLLTEAQVSAVNTRALLAKHAAISWRPLFGAEPFISQKHHRDPHPWRVEELCSAQALRAEGDILLHCVGSYANRCRLREAAIFSVRRTIKNDAGEQDAVSYATIEVHPRSGNIRQIRAWRNRPPNNTVMNIVHEWATAKGLPWPR